MRKDKQQSSFVNIGSSSLLVIFLILCLVTFAILSVSSAKSDYSFSERLAEHKTKYYEASARAERIAGEIDDVLYELAQESDTKSDGKNGMTENATARNGNTASYVAAVTKAFDGMQIDNVMLFCTTEDDLFISYEIPIGEKQKLEVRLLVTDYTKEDTYYKTVAWQVVPSGTWQGDESLNLMPVTQ